MQCMNCGAYLDPDERCDCEEREVMSLKQMQKKRLAASKNREMYEKAREEWQYG